MRWEVWDSRTGLLVQVLAMSLLQRRRSFVPFLRWEHSADDSASGSANGSISIIERITIAQSKDFVK